MPAARYCERVQPSPAATQQVRDWTRNALHVEGGSAIGSVSVSDASPADLLAAIHRQRLIEILDTHADALELPESIAEPLQAARTANRRSLMVQILELSRVSELLRAEGIDWLAMKGPALAMQSTGDPGARGSGDLDVLVAPASVEVAYRMLIARGWVVRAVGSAEPGSWAWRHILSVSNEMTFDGPGSTVDLHWRLDQGHRTLPAFGELWDRRTSMDLGGVEVETLGMGDAFTHACHHAAKDDWRWIRSLVDVHRLARHRDFTAPAVRIELSSLAVTETCIGLPEAVPAAVRRQVASASPSMGRRAIVAQDRPVFADYPFPAAQTLRDLRYRAGASGSAADLGRAAVSVVIPAKAVVQIDDRSAWTGVPRVLVRRGGWLVRRVLGWVRRTPRAGVMQTPSARR